MKNIKILLFLFLLFKPTLIYADEYVLIMSKNDNLCKHMQNIYNEDVKEYGCMQYKLHSEFNWITWMNKKIQLRPATSPNTVRHMNAKIGLFDINNDSKEELIVYTKSTLSNYEIDIYDIFPSEYFSRLNEIIEGRKYYSNVLKSLNSNDGTPQNVYDISKKNLKLISKRMRSIIESAKARGDKYEYFVGGQQNINFIKFNDRIYIEFKGPRGVGPNEKYSSVEHYCIVSEIRRDNSLNNQCLFFINKDTINEGGE